MYDGMTHGMFFVNNTWSDVGDGDEDGTTARENEDVISSAAGSTRGSSRASRQGGGGGGGAEAAAILGSVDDESLNTIAKGGLKGIIGLFEEYAANPEKCGKSEYR